MQGPNMGRGQFGDQQNINRQAAQGAGILGVQQHAFAAKEPREATIFDELEQLDCAFITLDAEIRRLAGLSNRIIGPMPVADDETPEDEAPPQDVKDSTRRLRRTINRHVRDLRHIIDCMTETVG